MSRYLLALIQEKIVSGLYVLSPLQVKFIKKEDLTHFLHDTLLECPDIMFKTNSDMIYVVMPHKDDVLVLMGLALMLFRLSHGCIPKDGKVKRLYRIDLTASLSTMERSLILDRVKPLVGDGSVYELISSFLDLPIIDDDGNVRSDISFGVIPPVGEITRVLFNIVLMDTFDREFPNKFPGITFYRFIHEVYISTREYDEVIFDEKAGYALLEELSMAGKIVSIGPCDEPLLCYYKRLVLIDINSKVHVCYPIEY
ncbi:hypothetical protein NMG60_11005522 [Bertholletia excelsa]